MTIAIVVGVSASYAFVYICGWLSGAQDVLRQWNRTTDRKQDADGTICHSAYRC